jgi:hypothetical protein
VLTLQGLSLRGGQASAIRVVSTTLAMLPVDIFVNVNRIGTPVCLSSLL